MITSTANSQVKQVNALAKKAKLRKETGLFLAEGPKMFEEAPKEWIEKVYVSESFLKNHESVVSGYRYETVSGEVMKYMADTQTPQGILALVRQPSWKMEDLIRRKQTGPALVIVLETLQDPGNLGTIIRAGEGAGVTGVVMNRETADIFSPKVIRSTMGAVYRVPFIYTDDLKETVNSMKREGIRFYAAHLRGKSDYDEGNYAADSAFMIGNEAKGLSEEAADLADCCIKIPMLGKVESLNAAVAASVLMFEAARQRRRR
ncbi:RNA methyltransferase [Clostridium sp. AM58-1XD]|uniref:TrmH family RNA methyltransferase n=1 Tax=Clostridium sp. AM58-1XD TaxID=2292307 RepID=UPI000E46E5D4|nr:RNA methyltransferase [Clostridium sp. AM58-1XD]RGY99650.1 RNA methyltransferase [Clostridium sp. AM58-1XD]